MLKVLKTSKGTSRITWERLLEGNKDNFDLTRAQQQIQTLIKGQNNTSKIKELVQRFNLNLEIIDNSKLTSNIFYIITENKNAKI